MRIIIKGKESVLDIEKKIKLEELFLHLKLNPLEYIAIDCEKETLLTPDVYLDNSSVVELKPVISGGT